VDAKLDLSTVVESTEVSASAVVLQTDRADVHITQTSREVNNLPLTGSAGRNYQSLMTLVPGTVMAGEQNSAAGSPQRSISFNVNGGPDELTLTNSPATGYVHYTFGFVATGAATDLRFTFEHDPAFWDLDSVSAVVPEPGTLALLTLAGSLVGLTRRRRNV